VTRRARATPVARTRRRETSAIEAPPRQPPRRRDAEAAIGRDRETKKVFSYSIDQLIA
jgi:hypothetical protein